MKAVGRLLSLWLPPLLLMGVIFALSAMPGDDADRGALHFLVRKLGHFVGYALLLALWWRALRSRFTIPAALGLAFALTVAYAITDELHQLSVEGRTGTPRDVAIDAAGAALSVALLAKRRPSTPA